MSLGDFFPDNIKDDFAKRKIDLGNSILIEIPDFSVTYHKYIVVVAKDEKNASVAYVVINSEANPNIAYNPYLKSLHLNIEKKNNFFLEKDSFVDCSKLREFPIEYVIDFLIKYPENAVGNVSSSVLKNIHTTLSLAPTIEPFIKKKFGL
jgi:hypothetical protein